MQTEPLSKHWELTGLSHFGKCLSNSQVTTKLTNVFKVERVNVVLIHRNNKYQNHNSGYFK